MSNVLILPNNNKELILKILNEDLAISLKKKETESNEALDGCIEVSKELIHNIGNNNFEIDSFQLGYLDTVLYNYYPKTPRESRKLIDTMLEISRLYKNPVYPIKNQIELEKAFQWAKEEKKSIGIHIKMPKLEKEEIIINSVENLDEKLKYYQGAYNEDLELKTFNEIRITGYERI